MVYSYTKIFYVCICDECNCRETVEGARNFKYNAAQAIRSIGWSYGRDGKVKCGYCRRHNLNDRYACRQLYVLLHALVRQ